ncbi:MAG: inositol monophosphatase family protein [Chloroflexi bacterium]|nr:MAG: inositol monophosphatase family protein [Chloroflexota bacterium]
MSDLVPLLRTGRAAIEQAVATLRSAEPGRVTAKADRDMVSELDLAIERAARQHLLRATPHLGFLGEEEGQDGPSDHTWIMDPIDGTANFLRALPLYGIALALVRESWPVIGIVALPVLNRTYWATEGTGAWLNGRRIAAATTATLNRAIVAVGDYAFGDQAAIRNPPMHALHHALADRAQRVRMLGSAAVDLAFVADATLDASITIGNNPWDMAAGVIIAREAGAHVIDLDGTEHHGGSTATIAVAPGIRDELLDAIRRQAAPPADTAFTKERAC